MVIGKRMPWSLVERLSPAFLFGTAKSRYPAYRAWYSSHSDIGSTNNDRMNGCQEISPKRKLRQYVKTLLKESGLDHGPQREEYSRRIAGRILHDLDILKHVKGMTMYIACERLMEVDTSQLLDHAFSKNIDVYLPRVLDSDSNMHFLKTHRDDTYDIVPPFGIHEPTAYMPDGVTKREDVCEATETLLDVMIVPGLAFGEQGERLGRGGGYYDTFIDAYIKRRRKKPLLVGVAFDEQIVQGIPMDAHDYYMDLVVTPHAVYRRAAVSKE